MPQNQHYVPQFHLGHFAPAGSETLQVYDKVTGRQFPSHIKNLAAERGFYDWEFEGEHHSAENKLGGLEGEAAAVIGRVVQQESLGDLDVRDHVVLASYVAMQKLRVRHVRIQFQALADYVRGWLRESGVDPREVKNFGDPTEEDVRLGSIMNLRNAKELVPDFLTKVWLLQRAASGRTFYLSDNPVTLHNSVEIEGRGNLGLRCRGIEIHLPLSSRQTLWMVCPSLIEEVRKNREEALKLWQSRGIRSEAMDHIDPIIRAIETGAPVDMLPAYMDHNNSLQVIFSSRFVYSGDGDFTLAKEMRENCPNIREGGLGFSFA